MVSTAGIMLSGLMIGGWRGWSAGSLLQRSILLWENSYILLSITWYTGLNGLVLGESFGFEEVLDFGVSLDFGEGLDNLYFWLRGMLSKSESVDDEGEIMVWGSGIWTTFADWGASEAAASDTAASDTATYDTVDFGTKPEALASGVPWTFFRVSLAPFTTSSSTLLTISWTSASFST